jgi:hypothetical protein
MLVALVSLDAAMRWRQRTDRRVQTKRSVEYIVPSESTGWAALPSTTARVVKRDGDRVVYDVIYSFDERGRRIVPQDPDARYDAFLLFFGDSGTFGEGVDARESLPFHVASRLSGVRAYNYAFHGYGPQHVLAKIEASDLRAEVAESRGLALYPLSAFLMDRLAGGSRTLAWSERLPRYVAARDGVRREGFHQAARPVRSLMLKMIGTSPLAQGLGIRWPVTTTDADRELFCRVMASARDELRRRLPGTDLLIVLHPRDPVAPFACFESYGLRTIDVRAAYGDTPVANLSLRGDSHPSPLAQELVGAALARELEPLLPEESRSGGTARSAP